MIKTEEYTVPGKEFRRLHTRLTYKRLIWFVVAETLCGATASLSTDTGMHYIGYVLVFSGLFLPYLSSAIAVSRSLKAPINRRPYVTELDEREVRQFSEGELVARIRYADLIKVQAETEGLVLFVTKASWFFVPRNAFASEQDFDAAVRLASVIAS